MQKHIITLQNINIIKNENRKIKFIGNDGSRYYGSLEGWTSSEFIIKTNDGIDTIAYDDLCNFVFMNEKRERSGTIILGITTIAAAIGLVYLARSLAPEKDDDGNISEKDDNPIRAHSILLAPILAPMGIFIIVHGLGMPGYVKYYYNKDEFTGHQ